MKKILGFAVTIMVAFVFLTYLSVSRAHAQSSYDVKKSDETVHVPAQPEDKSKSESESETKTIMVPTWPIQVPVRVSKDTEEKPGNPHAGENEGAREGLGGRK